MLEGNVGFDVVISLACVKRTLAINVQRFMHYQWAKILEIASKTAMIPALSG